MVDCCPEREELPGSSGLRSTKVPWEKPLARGEAPAATASHPAPGDPHGRDPTSAGRAPARARICSGTR
ncbi:hypothetical protein AV530_001110 [Patagioenas fasciata monilis]|uniref:Uncharacterized protein n=2 Tax=Patagioenas fasciata TaxID=372321 RepID=A0A1V4KTJ9_PATFA|nr:hypothetical protein AV530_001110 [Patagioenas fasciata monilis]